MKDPTRLTYISKTFYTPKNYQSSSTPTPTNHYPNNHSHLSKNQTYIHPSSSCTLYTNTFKPTSYTATSNYTSSTKPVLFKSSKYIMNKTEESCKDVKWNVGDGRVLKWFSFCFIIFLFLCFCFFGLLLGIKGIDESGLRNGWLIAIVLNCSRKLMMKLHKYL